jgi:cytochrome b6
VAILPLCMTALLGVHLFLVQWHGMSVPPGVEQDTAAPKKEMRFVPAFLLRDLVGWLAALGALALLAALFPWELGLKADPYAPAPAGIKPEWYFGWMFQTLRMLPSHVLGIEGEVLGIVGFGLAGLVWVMVPFLDAPDGRGPRARLWTAIGMLAIVYVIVFTLLVYRGGHPR